MQPAYVVRAVGDGSALGKVAGDVADDAVAGFLLCACLRNEFGRGAVRCTFALPDGRPAEHRQRCSGQAATLQFGQIELAEAVAIHRVVRTAQGQWHADMAIERQQALLHLIRLAYDRETVAGIVPVALTPSPPAGACAKREEHRQAVAQGVLPTWSCHCLLLVRCCLGWTSAARKNLPSEQAPGVREPPLCNRG
ncbi:hypothetical protein D3C79_757050 [compost metagenome]